MLTEAVSPDGPGGAESNSNQTNYIQESVETEELTPYFYSVFWNSESEVFVEQLESTCAGW